MKAPRATLGFVIPMAQKANGNDRTVGVPALKSHSQFYV